MALDGPTPRPKAPERPPGASVFRFPDGRGESRRTPASPALRFPDGRMAVAGCGKGAPPRSGGFFPGGPGSFSERTLQDRYPAYTVATATKGTSDC